MATVTRTHLAELLTGAGLRHAVVPLQNDVTIVVSERGGRVFGPFLTPDTDSLTWSSPALTSAEALTAFLAEDDWNLGGERIWVAPEIQFNVADRTDFWGTLSVPPQMDPGTWSLETVGTTGVALRQAMILRAHNLAEGELSVSLIQRIAAARDPLRDLAGADALLDGVVYAGYHHAVTLAQAAPSDIVAESWDLLALNPGGEILIPASPSAAYTDFFEPIDGDHLTREPKGLRLRITGDRRYKIGLKAAHLFGRLGYRGALPDGRAYLLVRNFYNDPSSPYSEEPANRAGCAGHSVHVYNDGGMFGQFGELEVNGRPIGGDTERVTGTDTFTLWCYVGPPRSVDEIAIHLLGLV